MAHPLTWKPAAKPTPILSSPVTMSCFAWRLIRPSPWLSRLMNSFTLLVNENLRPSSLDGRSTIFNLDSQLAENVRFTFFLDGPPTADRWRAECYRQQLRLSYALLDLGFFLAAGMDPDGSCAPLISGAMNSHP